MIVQAEGTTVLLITQPDHAALAGRIMTRWKHRDFDRHPRRASVLLAITEHDNGWHEVDAAPVLDEAGRVLDFVNVPAATRRAIWPRGVERLSGEPWAAALVAQHAVHVYRHYREEPEWAPFFVELEALRDAHLARAAAAAALTLDDLLADYFFVRMGDLLSLTFCNAWSEAPDELGYLIRCTGTRLTVAPDPFERRDLPIDVPARRLPNQAFSSTAGAARNFQSAAIVTFSGTVSGLAAVS
jgi:hypothetical protein